MEGMKRCRSPHPASPIALRRERWRRRLPLRRTPRRTLRCMPSGEATSLAGKRVVVMGLGRFGGGVGVTRWLCEQGADVLLTDLDDEARLAASLESIRDLVRSGAVTLRLGGHNVGDFTTHDLVVANPAVPKPWDNRFLRAATAAGVPITTEIGLLVERLPAGARTIGVTGSAGKSTTSAMLAHALRAAIARGLAPNPPRNVHFGGNIGGSLLGALGTISEHDAIVLELSSAMLHWLGDGAREHARNEHFRGGWSPRIALMTNLAPNHLDWHGAFEHYARSKGAIFAHQRDGDIAIAGSPEAAALFADTGAQRIELPPDEDDPAWMRDLRLRIPGAHNRRNALMALTGAACALGCEPHALVRTLDDFEGLPHRLRLVAERRVGAGVVRCYDDSKSTTPESTLLALRAFEEEPGVGADRVHLIAGGYDKGVDLAPVARCAERIAGLYAIGATGPALVAAAGERARREGRAHDCATLERAVAIAIGRAQPGDVVLLSPACASWDQFTNFEERGDAFARLVRETPPGGA
ncbi:MAG: UDP-N-acetylmuramoyl-L-alanine--D-glutamate ligase [Phycisphaerales bacterium]|nr:MAG: UDP-N-acetylmuramoyl-L-alanine--D-glutamate ligase [Phycisphaerales bacterium]